MTRLVSFLSLVFIDNLIVEKIFLIFFLIYIFLYILQIICYNSKPNNLTYDELLQYIGYKKKEKTLHAVN